MAKVTKSAQLLDYLRRTRTVSPMEAMIHLQIGSPTKEIHRLREGGARIEQVWRKNPATGQRYSRYFYLGDAA